jgi:tRNA threonylcarbamoyladenosine biosynthesis protein TsaE
LSSILETRTLRTLLWPDEAACAASAQVLASHVGLRDAFIELHGPLGAGKTTFVRHLLHALGVMGHVRSPTYAIMEPYEVTRAGVAFNIWHFDFYRFNDPQEWEDAGFRDVFASHGLKLAEWPEKAAGLLPQADLQIHIEPTQDELRSVRMSAHGARGMELIIA